SDGAESQNFITITTAGVTDVAGAKSALKTITVTGDQQLNLDVVFDGATSDLVIDASGSNGGLIASLDLVKDTGSIKLGIGTDVITVTNASTSDGDATTTTDTIESIVNFEKAAAVAVSTATADALAAADAIKAADKLVLADATVANANG